MTRVALLFCFVFGACTPSPSTTSTVTLPAVSASAASSSSGSLLTPSAIERVVVGGDAVDLTTMKVVALTTDRVYSSASARGTTYVFANGASGNQVRAYNLDGSPRWAKPANDCWTIVATSNGIICAGNVSASYFRERDGDDKPVGARTSVMTVVRVGRRVLVLHADKTIDALDDSGDLVGSVASPVVPDRGYAFGRGALFVAGSIACGAQSSDFSTTAFCVDDAPHIVWTKTIAVPGGLIRQADDDVLVIAAGSWAKSASEVVRVRDGTTLLHTTTHLSAAIASHGVLDVALASEPAIVAYDKTGAQVWAAKTALHSEAMRAHRVGANIVTALYNPIATGTELAAFDASSGALVWQASVESFDIDHSKYSNEVDMRVRGAHVLLFGRESSQDFAQLFDATTGARTASILRRR